MKSFYLDNLYFNGKLHSLRLLCNMQGIDLFCLKHSLSTNRVLLFLKSNIQDYFYIENVLFSDNFEEDFNKLVEKSNYIKNLENNYCGIGLNETKRLLNQLSKTNNNANLIKIALEIEEINIKAKKTFDNIELYQYKNLLILELIDICDKMGINFGFIKSDIAETESIVFFDMPCGQLSWHAKINWGNYRKYNKKWDGISTNLLKIEEYIKKNLLMLALN